MEKGDDVIAQVKVRRLEPKGNNVVQDFNWRDDQIVLPENRSLRTQNQGDQRRNVIKIKDKLELSSKVKLTM